MTTRRAAWKSTILLFLAFSIGCAGIPVREEVKVDQSLPVGEIEGNQFTGIRFPFKVSAPAAWKVSTEYPKFMVDLGYDKEGLQQSQGFRPAFHFSQKA
jgi:hypothetical protein